MVSIITVNYNQTELTCALLDSIRRVQLPDLEVIVVDNGSTPDPGAVFLHGYPFVQYIRSEKNLGFAGGNNLAIPRAKGEYLFFLNNDAELTERCIPRLIQFLESQPQAGIVSPLICYPQSDTVQYGGMTPIHRFTGRNRTLGKGLKQTAWPSAPYPTAYAHGAAMMIPRCVLQQVGPMSEDYFLYYEELDWSERIRTAGFGVWVVPSAVVWHRESATLQQMGAAKTFYLTRNRIRFMRRHFDRWSFGVFCIYFGLVAAPKFLMNRLLRADWAAIHAFTRALYSTHLPT